MQFFDFVRKHLGEDGREWLFLVHCGALTYSDDWTDAIPGCHGTMINLGYSRWSSTSPDDLSSNQKQTMLEVAKIFVETELDKYARENSNGR